jgi:quinol monooxygenase YgiN
MGVMNLIIEFSAKPNKFNELYQTLQALLPTMRIEEGCRESHIYRDVEDDDVFFLSSYWDDAVKLKTYMMSNSGITLLGAIDLLSKAVRVRMGSDSPWGGIEVLKTMRKAN